MSALYIVNPAVTIGPNPGNNVGNAFLVRWGSQSLVCNLEFVKTLLAFGKLTGVDAALSKLNAAGYDADIAETINSLIGLKLLISQEEAEEGIIWRENGWGDSWVFHQSTQNQKFQDANPDTAWQEKDSVLQKYMDGEKSPEIYTNFDNLKLIELPSPSPIQGNFEKIFLERRTSRNFIQTHMDGHAISSILQYSTLPLRTTREEQGSLSQAHAAMHLHSWLSFAEIGLYIHDCEGISQGIYFYDLKNNGLREVKKGDFSELINKATWKQGVEGASLTIFILADLKRYMWKYRNPRHYKAVWVQSASLAHRMVLLGQSYGYGAFQSPAMHDETALQLFDTTIDCLMPMYLVGIGPCKTV